MPVRFHHKADPGRPGLRRRREARPYPHAWVEPARERRETESLEHLAQNLERVVSRRYRQLGLVGMNHASAKSTSFRLRVAPQPMSNPAVSRLVLRPRLFLVVLHSPAASRLAEKLRASKATFSFIGMFGSRPTNVHVNQLMVNPADRPGHRPRSDIHDPSGPRTARSADRQATRATRTPRSRAAASDREWPGSSRGRGARPAHRSRAKRGSASDARYRSPCCRSSRCARL